MLKKITPIVFSLLVIGIIIFSVLREPKQIKMTTVKESYNYVSTNDEGYNLNIAILINQKNSYITNIDEINNAYIGSVDELYKVDIKEINYGFETKIEADKYYYYSYTIHFDLEFDIEVPNASLIIYYLNQKDITIDIGSISCYKVDNKNYSDLSLTNLKGVINEINNKKTLVGIVFEINNNTDAEFDINDIFLFDFNTYITGIYEIGNQKIGYADNISEIINKQYYISDQEIIVSKKLSGKKRYLLTLGYRNHYQIPCLGFKIYYTVSGFNREYIFSPFTFYKDHQRNIPINELDFYIYEHH